MKACKDLTTFPNDKARLAYLASRMTNLCERGTEEEIAEVFDQIKDYRLAISGGGDVTSTRRQVVSAPPLPKKNNNKPKTERVPKPAFEPVEDNSAGMQQGELIERVVAIVRKVEEEGKEASPMLLGQQKEARAIKTALAEHKCPRLAIVFRKFPQTFAINDKVVTVLDSYIPFMDQEPVEVIDEKRKTKSEMWAARKRAMAEAGGDATKLPKKVKTEA